MASAIYGDDGDVQIIIMIWSLPWESMTLGQANQLVVIGALIRSAVVRANKYLAALEDEMYVGESHLLEADAFKNLVTAYTNAMKAGLTECVVVKLHYEGTDSESYSEKLYSKLRDHDYVGYLEDGSLGMLLANSGVDDAEKVMERLKAFGYTGEIMEEID